MWILVTYDVNTETAEGRSRLRRVAKTCEGYGQRVQKSVFECTVNDRTFHSMKRRLLEIMDENQDSIRFYKLPGKPRQTGGGVRNRRCDRLQGTAGGLTRTPCRNHCSLEVRVRS